MGKPYKFLLYCTNIYYGANADSEVPTGANDPPTTLPTPSEANGWIAVDGMWLNPEYTGDGDEYTALNGGLYSDIITRGKLSLRTTAYRHPDETNDLRALQKALGKNYVYLAFVDYDVVLVTGSNAIAVSAKYTTEHDASTGTKRLTIDMKYREAEAP